MNPIHNLRILSWVRRIHVRFQFFTMASMKMTVFWDAVSSVYFNETTRRYILEGCQIQISPVHTFWASSWIRWIQFISHPVYSIMNHMNPVHILWTSSCVWWSFSHPLNFIVNQMNPTDTLWDSSRVRWILLTPPRLYRVSHNPVHTLCTLSWVWWIQFSPSHAVPLIWPSHLGLGLQVALSFQENNSTKKSES
jgi:hypothetical protein